jgi:hypothetical protein
MSSENMTALALARELVRVESEALRAAEAAMMQTPEALTMMAARERLERARNREIEARDHATVDVLAAYRETGDKHPWPGATVRVTQAPDWDPAALVPWCVTNARKFLRVNDELLNEMPLVEMCIANGKTDWLIPDQTKIKKGAGILADLGAPITFEGHITVAIDSDLSQYMPSDKEDDREQSA